MIDRRIKNRVLRLIKGDITDLDVDAFVYNARTDLQLGSGFGTAISVRGGPTVQDDLKKLAPIGVCDAVITGAGNLKAKYIIHVVGPRFQEENTEEKLKRAVLNVLKLADEKGIESVAFPPLSTGFYGVPLTTCADILLETIKEYLNGDTKLKEVIVCLLDNREFAPFKAKLEKLSLS